MNVNPTDRFSDPNPNAPRARPAARGSRGISVIPFPPDRLDAGRALTWDTVNDVLADEGIQSMSRAYRASEFTRVDKGDDNSSDTSGDRNPVPTGPYTSADAWMLPDTSLPSIKMTLGYSPLNGYQHPADTSVWIPILGVDKNTSTGTYSVHAGLDTYHADPPTSPEQYQQDIYSHVTDIFKSDAWQSVLGDMGDMEQMGVLHSAAEVLTRLSEALQTALQQKKAELELHGSLDTHSSQPTTTEMTGGTANQGASSHCSRSRGVSGLSTRCS